jgi:small ligand-binding sensory domain FIST
MPFAAALATGSDLAAAARELCAAVRDRSTAAPDLVFTFFSPHFSDEASALGRALRDGLAPRALVGCVAESVIGPGREIEGEPAVSLWAAWWGKKVSVESFHLTLEQTADGPSIMGWPDSITDLNVDKAALLLLGDPFTVPTDLLLRRINEDYTGLRVMGGMASGIRAPGQCRLLLDDGVRDSGAICILLQGSIGLRPVVSQGCRPIGRPFVVTKGEENVILQLGGRSPLNVLQEL